MPHVASSVQNALLQKGAKANIASRKGSVVTKRELSMPKGGEKYLSKKNIEVKSSHKKKLQPATPARATSHGTDTESEKCHEPLSTTKRISRRKTLAVDVNKPIIILRPHDNPQILLNMTEREHQDFLAVLHDDERIFLDNHTRAETAEGNHLPGLFREDSISSQVVVTPGVSVSRPRIASRSIPPAPRTKRDIVMPSGTAPPEEEHKSQSSVRDSSSVFASAPPGTSSTWPGGASRYSDYDADSSDEEFLSTLRQPPPPGPTRPLSKKRKRPSSPSDPQEAPLPASPLSCECFEHMVSVLERELEVAKVFLREKVRSERQDPVTAGLLGDGLEVVRHVSVFLQGGKAGAGGALRKAQSLVLSAGAIQSRTASVRSAMQPISNTTKGLAQEGMDGLLAGLGGAGLSGLSLSAPAVHQLLALLSKESRNPRTGTGVTKTLLCCELLQALVPQDHARRLLEKVYVAWHPSVDRNTEYLCDEKGRAGRVRAWPNTSTKTSVTDSLLSKVYLHWLHKRAGRVESLLRCYHNFMMDEWHQEPSMPPLPEDTDINQLREAHRQLHMLRHDLDQARLIMDRVRKREKLKKDLVRNAGEGFNRVMRLVEQFRRAKAAGGGAALWQQLAAATKRYGYSLQGTHEEGEGGDDEEGEGGSCGVRVDTSTPVGEEQAEVPLSARAPSELDVLSGSRKRRRAPDTLTTDEQMQGRGRLAQGPLVGKGLALSGGSGDRCQSPVGVPSDKRARVHAPRQVRRASAKNRDTARDRSSASVLNFHSSWRERSGGEEDEVSSQSTEGSERDSDYIAEESSSDDGSSSYADRDTVRNSPSEPSSSRVSSRLRSRTSALLTRHSPSTRSGRRSGVPALLKDSHISHSGAATATDTHRRVLPEVIGSTVVTAHARTRSFAEKRRTTYSTQLCSLAGINTLMDRVAGFHHY